MKEVPPNPHGYFSHENRPVKPREVVPQPASHAARVVQRQPLFKRYRRVAIGGLLLVAAALLCAWALDRLYFEYRFGPFFPFGASASTKVLSRSWPPPQGVPKTYSRLIRETLGCYYPGFRATNNWFDELHKTLKDTLEEYGAEVRGNKIYDASGREIRIIGRALGWHARRHQLIMNNCTVFVVDIAETDDDE